MIQQLTKLMADMGGRVKNKIRMSRTTEPSKYDVMVKELRRSISLVPGVRFVGTTNEITVEGDDGPQGQRSLRVSRALAAALIASCLEDDLQASAESGNALVEEGNKSTFAELLGWMMGEMGGDYPLTDYIDGLGLLFKDESWTSARANLLLNKLHEVGVNFAATLSLFLKRHEVELLKAWPDYRLEDDSDEYEGNEVKLGKKKKKKVKALGSRGSGS